MTNREVFEAVKSGYRMEHPQDCPEEICNIMSSCWKEEPKERPTFQQIFDRINSMCSRTSVVESPYVSPKEENPKDNYQKSPIIPKPNYDRTPVNRESNQYE
jgi:hypothetical protein